MASPAETCSRCDGTGWILELIDQRKVARPCVCRGASLRKGRLDSAGIPERYRECTLDNFYDDRSLELKKAKAVAREFVDQFPFVEAGLLLIGASGLGKTHLACAILSELVSKKGVLGFYADSSELMNRIQTSFRPDAGGSRESVLAHYTHGELLVLDEIGATPPHPWVQDVLYDLLNTRYNRKTVTIVTTNFADEPDPTTGVKQTLEDRIGYRTRSRLYEMCLTVQLRGDDYRKQVLNAQIRTRF
jgi:DNA replication protein DnaC